VGGGIAHAFNGSLQQAQAFIDLGFKLGFGGAVTYERALQLRRLAAELPLSALVLETDAPDIPPHWLYVTAEQRAAGQPPGAQRTRPSCRASRGLPPVVSDRTVVLVLGSFPGAASLRRSSTTRTRKTTFWRILQACGRSTRCRPPGS
jgi:hypothetical protein